MRISKITEKRMSLPLSLFKWKRSSHHTMISWLRLVSLQNLKSFNSSFYSLSTLVKPEEIPLFHYSAFDLWLAVPSFEFWLNAYGSFKIDGSLVIPQFEPSSNMGRWLCTLTSPLATIQRSFQFSFTLYSILHLALMNQPKTIFPKPSPATFSRNQHPEKFHV